MSYICFMQFLLNSMYSVSFLVFELKHYISIYLFATPYCTLWVARSSSALCGERHLNCTLWVNEVVEKVAFVARHPFCTVWVNGVVESMHFCSVDSLYPLGKREWSVVTFVFADVYGQPLGRLKIVR